VKKGKEEKEGDLRQNPKGPEPGPRGKGGKVREPGRKKRVEEEKFRFHFKIGVPSRKERRGEGELRNTSISGRRGEGKRNPPNPPEPLRWKGGKKKKR